MHDTTILGYVFDGDFSCNNCYDGPTNEKEQEDNEITPFFVANAIETVYCGYCGDTVFEC